MFTNLLKAVVATMVTPVAVVADLLAFPSSAYNDTSPFERTEKMLDVVQDNVNKALR